METNRSKDNSVRQGLIKLKVLQNPHYKTLFFSHINICGPHECWPWTACRTGGYGLWGIRKGELSTSVLAHRMSHMFHTNKIIGADILVLHTCDNPPCCNPAHLFEGTDRTNIIDAFKKGRGPKAIGERNGCAKTTDAEVVEIRRLWREENYTYQQLADMFGVCWQTIGRIIREERWRHLL